MKIHSLALFILLGVTPRVDTCTNSSEQTTQYTAATFQPVNALRLTKLSLSEIPDFEMPKGSFWAAMKLSPDKIDQQRAFVLKGNTFFPIRTLVEKEAYQQITNAQGRAFLKTLPPGTGLYEMLGDDDLCKSQGALHGLWTNPVTVTPVDVKNYLMGWWYSRAENYGWGNARIMFDLDLEGFPAAWKNNQVLAEGVKLLRQEHPNVEFGMYASGMGNLYPEGNGDPANPYGQIGGTSRYNLYKQNGFTYFEMMPYAHYEEVLIGQGKPYANFQDYAKRSSLHIKKCLEWLDPRAPYAADKNYRGFSWVMTRYEGGGLEMIAPHICESLPLLMLVSGAARSGGGLCNWNPGVDLNAADYALEAGKWRASQFNKFWENPKTEYNLHIEFSLDNGETWTNDIENWQAKAQKLGISWFDYMYKDPNPMGVRAAVLDNKLVVVAAHRPGLEEGKVQNILCRYKNKTWKMSLPYHQVVAGTVTL
ncbi:hypothetical protein BWI96_09205 [Siphonobacter sp. SORGH_AS_0500]|uniref:hypothetical protein n=1 Tax=Siphonobacter sp. SORGH_AS_0500 TaxID=1864824 RepID=UPI000CB0976D|nr:hypothetical protein [Siphonobacter sp. SORGH_AS_0500]PKK37043.1 hypothetical protein BWI96_09205 [Siphonobacter sp. SORGH_AS_0500]